MISGFQCPDGIRRVEPFEQEHAPGRPRPAAPGDLGGGGRRIPRSVASAASRAPSRSPTRRNIAWTSARSVGLTLSTGGEPGKSAATRRTVASLTAQTSHCSCVRIRSGRSSASSRRRGRRGSPLLRDQRVDRGARGRRGDPAPGQVGQPLDARREVALVRHADEVVATAQGADQLGQRGEQADDAHGSPRRRLSRGRAGRRARRRPGRRGAGPRRRDVGRRGSGTMPPCGIAADLDAALGHIDDPVVGDARLGVEPGLHASILGEAAVGDLDHAGGRPRAAGAACE